MAKSPREMLSVLLGSGDGRVVPTNQSARGDRHGSHRGSAFGSNSQGLHEPARRFEPLLPHEPRWVDEQVQRPQGHRQRLQEPPCPPDQEPRAVEDQSRESWFCKGRMPGEASHSLEMGFVQLRLRLRMMGWGETKKTRLRAELHRG